MNAKEREYTADLKNGGMTAAVVLTEAAYLIVGAALGRAELPFGTVPLGFSALCASGIHTVSVFVGLCLSLIGRKNPLAYLAAYAVALLVRAAFSSLTAGGGDNEGRAAFFRENTALRAVAAAAGAFAVGLYRLLIGGFLYYDLFSAITGIVVSAAAAVFLLPLEDGKSGTLARSVGLAVLICGMTWGLRGLSFYGISASVFFAMLASLAVTRRQGVLDGAFVALASGLCVSPRLAPLFVFGTVAYGFLSSVTPFFGAFASFAVGIAWGGYIDGISAVSTLLPALLASNFVFLTVDRLYFGAKSRDKNAENVAAEPCKTEIGGNEAALARLDDASERIKLLCEGFSALSELLEQTDGDTAGDGLFEIGEIDAELDCEAGFRDVYLSDFGRCFALAECFGATAEYLAAVMQRNAHGFLTDSETGRRICRELADGFPELNASVCVSADGEKRIVVCSRKIKLLEANAEGVGAAIERACGFRVKRIGIAELDGCCLMTFSRAAVLLAQIAGRKRCAADETEFCGDSFGISEGDAPCFAFISDGMGSGREAARVSELCSVFLRKLLPINDFAGDCVGATLKTLNSFLCGRNGIGVRECTATLDLCSLDLVEGKMSFYKCGAAPSYIFRDGSLFKVQSRTAPMGILKEPDIGRINAELLPGDIIIMVSDGVTQGREECPELFEFLRSRIMTHSSDRLADAVMHYADERGCTDDVSAVVIKITEAFGSR